MTYCLEEGLVKLKKIKEFEIRLDLEGSHKMTQEELDNHKQDKSICKANF
jgi:hypothetical protein